MKIETPAGETRTATLQHQDDHLFQLLQTDAGPEHDRLHRTAPFDRPASGTSTMTAPHPCSTRGYFPTGTDLAEDLGYSIGA